MGAPLDCGAGGGESRLTGLRRKENLERCEGEVWSPAAFEALLPIVGAPAALVDGSEGRGLGGILVWWGMGV